MLTHAGGSQRPESLNLWLHIWENVAMGAAIELRSDFDGATLRRLARTMTNANQGRRLLALAEIYDGRSRSDAARIGSAVSAYRLCATGSCGSIPSVPMG